MTFNPYQPPKSMVDPPNDKILVEADGVVFVLMGQELPKRCIKCNAETHLNHRQTYTWHSPWWYLLLIFYPLYFILYLFIRKNHRLAVGLCSTHHRQRKKILWLSLVFLMVMMPIIYQAFLQGFPLIVWMGCLAVVISIILAAYKTKVITVIRIDNTGIWFKGCGKDFLTSLKSSG